MILINICLLLLTYLILVRITISLGEHRKTTRRISIPLPLKSKGMSLFNIPERKTLKFRMHIVYFVFMPNYPFPPTLQILFKQIFQWTFASLKGHYSI